MINELHEAIEEYQAWLDDETTIEIRQKWSDTPYVQRTFALIERLAGHVSGIKGLIDVLDKR